MADNFTAVPYIQRLAGRQTEYYGRYTLMIVGASS
jgi:hypothetical protein